MVTPEQLYGLLRKRPFEPFRVHVKDGRVYDVKYYDMNLVGKSWFVIGIPMPGMDDPIAHHSDMIPLDWITSIEPMPQPVG